MSVKRLKIRLRPRLSDVDLEWVAGQATGYRQGYAKGKHENEKYYVQEKAKLLHEIVQLEQDLATARAAAALNARTVEGQRGRIMELEQERALLQSPAKSDWLSLPPFVVNVDPSLGPDKWMMTSTVTGRSRPGNMIVRPRSHGGTPQPPIHELMAEGGILSSGLSNRFLEQILNSPSILGQVRTAHMRVPIRGGGVIPPANPSFHWNAEDSRLRDGEPIRELHGTPVEQTDFRDTQRVNMEAVSAAFRMPPLVTGSEMRTPEAEEGIRRASAEGVTARVGGHSHAIDLDIRVDDSQMQDAITRINGLTEAMGNAVVSTEDFERAMLRILRLERTMGVEAPPEENPSEENVTTGTGSGS